MKWLDALVQCHGLPINISISSLTGRGRSVAVQRDAEAIRNLQIFIIEILSLPSTNTNMLPGKSLRYVFHNTFISLSMMTHFIHTV